MPDATWTSDAAPSDGWYPLRRVESPDQWWIGKRDEHSATFAGLERGPRIPGAATLAAMEKAVEALREIAALRGAASTCPGNDGWTTAHSECHYENGTDDAFSRAADIAQAALAQIDAAKEGA